MQLRSSKQQTCGIKKLAMSGGKTAAHWDVWTLILRAVALLMLLFSWNVAFAGMHDPKSEKVTREGSFIFKHYCSVCHGDKGNGQSRARGSFAVPPRDYTTPEAAIELTRPRMINSVTNGRPGTAMIAWRTELTEKEIGNVVDYIRGTFMQLNNDQPRARPSEKLLASRGGVLYMQACAMCHGDTGKRMISGRMNPPPTDFTSSNAMSELTHKRIVASISQGRPGTAMKGYGNEFSKEDIEAMAKFIREAFMTSSAPKK